MIITISGMPGSGKSSVSKILAKKLRLNHYSMGDLQRKYAKEKRVTIEELGELESRDDKIDKEIDKYQKSLSKEDNFIIDGRISFYFIPNSIKIFLDCSVDECARRIFNSKRDSSERKTNSLEESKHILIKREKTNQKRFFDYYGIDFLDRKNYNLIIDTTNSSKEDVVDKILTFIKKQ
jgi:CMP/dCMP kinase